MGDNTAVSDLADGTNPERSREVSTSSGESTPPEHDAENYPPETQQTQKRKGGRKPIYATSEERKQRNRQAQAAFRERRTEYIKQLESTIKIHEEQLKTLQQSHRSAAEECLMLRYKNSLLERILLEKAIDVQAELAAKGGSPHLGPIRVPPPTTLAPITQPIQRYALNRMHQQRRSTGSVSSKTDAPNGLPQAKPDTKMLPNPSPHSQPTPASHSSSPTTTMSSKSPTFLPQGGAISPSFGPVAQQHQQYRSQQPLRPQFNTIAPAAQRPTLVTNFTSSSGVSTSSTATSGGGSAAPGGPNGPTSNYYPSPFQSHMDQLGKLSQQEYDAQADMLDDESNDLSAGSGPYPQQFQQAITPQSMQPPATQPQTHHYQQLAPAQAQSTTSPNNAVFPGMSHLFDPNDPMFDADPFGLSASMHFPTQFTYESR